MPGLFTTFESTRKTQTLGSREHVATAVLYIPRLDRTGLLLTAKNTVEPENLYLYFPHN